MVYNSCNNNCDSCNDKKKEEYNGSMFDFNVGDVVWMLDKDDNDFYIIEEVIISEEKAAGYYCVDCKLANKFQVPTYILYGTPEKCQARCDELNNGCTMSSKETSWFGAAMKKIDIEESRHTPWGMFLSKNYIKLFKNYKENYHE